MISYRLSSTEPAMVVTRKTLMTWQEKHGGNVQRLGEVATPVAVHIAPRRNHE
jgi:hypothetical protein